jgi:serine/threonine protein kinase
MNSSSQLESIFFAALDKGSAPERAAFLDEACVGDGELRRRLERMLEAQAGGFLQEPALGHPTSDYEPITEGPGEVIGPYQLLEQIGEGGFGVVFMAEQERPVRRKVALKIIKPGMDTRQVIGRFEAERQALAMMDHPNIAKVYDAGATENGRPYFVMELVQGVPITEYCDECNLSTRERLELFITVCQAVQHAHQKGIIHRDIKPTNVLVAIQDGQPAPKIIDFGVAKAVGQRLTEHTLTTAFAQMVGSPLYMSPEQAELSPLGVDTRSDIYSLGVMLYELLTGKTPFDKDRLHAASYDELRRIIREEEPPRPSARLSSHSLRERAGVRETANQATTIAERRRTACHLSRQVRGELDWIVMKCLEKDRNRRYETPSSLARDIERYLHDEPVQACPPSLAYRFRKFVRRNKMAAAFIVLLTVGLVALAISNVMIQSALTQKNDALLLAQTNEQRATNEARRAQAISGFLSDMLGSSYPSQIKDSQYTVRQLLDDSSAELDHEFSHQPEVEAAIQSVIGTSYWRLGVFDRAERHLIRALDLHRQVYDADDRRVANSLVDYAWNLGAQGRVADAEACAREAVSIYQKHDSNPQESDYLANALYITAIARLQLGDRDGYRQTCSALVDLRVRSSDVVANSRPVWPLCLGPDSLDDMSRLVTRAEQYVAENSQRAPHFCLYVLGAAHYRSGNYEEAARRLEESIEVYPNIPGTGADTINYQQLLLAMTKWQLGERDEALLLLAETQPAIDRELQAPSTTWVRRTSLELLRTEAEGLIRKKETDDKSMKDPQNI